MGLERAVFALSFTPFFFSLRSLCLCVSVVQIVNIARFDQMRGS